MLHHISHRLSLKIPVAQLLLLLLAWIALPGQAQSPLILGVHPFLTEQEVIKRFSPLAQYLSQRLNRQIEVRVGRDYQDHMQAIGKDIIDIAYMGPAVYVKATRIYGRKPLLARLEADDKPTFQGHIITQDNSALRSLADLHNHFFAFGDPNSTMSSLIPRAMLRQNGVNLADLSGYRHYDGHNNVALAVLSGEADAGAVKEEVYHNYRARGLRSLQATPAISEHLFVTRTNLDPHLVREIRELMLGLYQPAAVERVLQPIKSSATGLVAVRDRDYDNLRQIMDVVGYE